MKRLVLASIVLLLVSSVAVAAPLATAARSVIPKDVQQIICVDYRSLKSSPTALALKKRVLPPDMRDFETALRGLGIDPDKEVESLVFVSFRVPKQGLQIIGIAQGDFPTKAVLKRMRLRKVKATKHGDALVYPVSTMQMSFLDDFTMLFGISSAIRSALDVQNGMAESVNSNSQVSELITDADGGPIWSVLDASGTQNLVRSALGDAAGLADYETIKKRLLGARYIMDFTNGVKFDLNVVTSDSWTASALSSLLKAGMMYRRMNSAGSEKAVLENVTVDSDNDKLQLHFRSDDAKFQALLQSNLFAAISR
ncbi:MAG: hypothetical protein ACE14M_07615 [Terriglobales bacterium]